MEEVALAEEQQAEKAAEAARQQQIQDQLEELKQDAAQKAQDAASAEMSVKNLEESILQNKKLIPIDPWRQIGGTKEYVKSYGSGFVKFNGTVRQMTPDGVLVEGNFGDTQTNFFVENFPYKSKYSIGDNLFLKSPENNGYVALPDGIFVYIAVDGSIQSIPKLNYGEPCSRPWDADTIEAAAQKFTPDEEQQINSAKDNAEQKKTQAKAADAELQAFSLEIENEKEAEIQAKNAPQNRALKFNQELADRGDPYGLLRMGERYRDGDGVPKDLSKAREYLTKAANAGDPTAVDELKSLNQSS